MKIFSPIAAVISLVAAVFLQGCGQTGDLYLPGDPSGQTPIVTGETQPDDRAEENEDDEAQDQPGT